MKQITVMLSDEMYEKLERYAKLWNGGGAPGVEELSAVVEEALYDYLVARELRTMDAVYNMLNDGL